MIKNEINYNNLPSYYPKDMKDMNEGEKSAEELKKMAKPEVLDFIRSRVRFNIGNQIRQRDYYNMINHRINSFLYI